MMLDHSLIHDRGLYKPYFLYQNTARDWTVVRRIHGELLPTYPLGNKQFAIENCHRNSGFTH